MPQREVVATDGCGAGNRQASSCSEIPDQNSRYEDENAT
jgi:hypothetical protein